MQKDEKIRICHVISDAEIGGAGVLLCNLLSSLDRERFSPEVIAPRHSALLPRLRETGVSVYEGDFVGERSLSVRGAREVLRHVRRSRPHIVHTHGAAFGRVAARLTGAIAVNTRHCDTKMKTTLYNSITDFTVATSRAMLEKMRDNHVKNCIFIPNGSAEQKRLNVNERLQIRKRLDLPSDAIVIGFVGRLERVKGCDIFLRGASLCMGEDCAKKLYFVIVGDGREMESLQELSRSLGIDSRVRFCGYSDRAWEYMNIFDVGVNSSVGSETCSLAISEMMSLGIPIVASDIEGNAYMTRGCGMLFSSGEPYSLASALCRLAEDREERLSLGERCRKRYDEEFSLSSMAKSYSSLYTHLVNT